MSTARDPCGRSFPQDASTSAATHRGWYRTKVARWIGVPEALHIAARRIDRRSAILGHGDIADPWQAAHRIEPTNIVLPTPGCWQVAGGVGRDVLMSIFRARG